MAINDKVLVVEDDADLLTTMCSVLTTAGFVVDGVRDVRAAHERLRREQPDVMLLDLVLDGRHCEELLESLAGDANAPPVVLCSATHRTGSKFSSRYAVSFIPKPFDVDQLIDAIEDARLTGRRPSRPMRVAM